MKFTFWAVGCPFLGIGVLFIINGGPHAQPAYPALAGLFAVWFWGGLPATFIYWLVRVVRHAWRDGTPQTPTRPAGWIYPDER